MAQADNATFEWTAQGVCRTAKNYLIHVYRIKAGRNISVTSILYAMRRTLPDIADPDTADRVLQRVLETCPPKCASMVAMVYGRVNSLFCLANDLVASETMDETFLKGAMEYLFFHDEWSSISAIFDRRPHFVYSELSRHSVGNVPAAGIEFFRKVVRHAHLWQSQGLARFVRDVMTDGLVEQFNVLVNSPPPVVRKEVAANLKSLMTEVCTERMRYGVGSERSARLGACFMLAAQAGLFAAADPETGRECTVMAATANQPDLVLCLHHCGTLGSGDFSAMLAWDNVKAIGSKDPAQLWGLLPIRGITAVPFDEEAKKTALGIKSFLAKQASTPSSLKKMCLQYVSRQVGWGHDREVRIREMDVLDSLKDDMRFKGLEKVLRKEKQT